MDLPDQLHCLFSAIVEDRDDSYVVEVPKEEVHIGDVRHSEMYRVALLPAPSAGDSTQSDSESMHEHRPSEPPVEEGETRTVEIEDIGDQGDGIARVERGFVVIVPDTEQGEQVAVEITDVHETVAFAEVVKRLSYYD